MKTKSMLLIGLLVIMTATPALAWRSVRSGQKNFERAWSAYLSKRDDKAKEYFASAATYFASGLAEMPPSRTTLFPSNLTMAGMSFYFADRFEETVKTMTMVTKKDHRQWEAPLFEGMALARLDRHEEAIKALDRFLASASGQFMVNDAAQKLATALGSGQDVDAATAQLERAYFLQMQRNVNTSGKNSPLPQDRCDGNYWWRYSRQPCPDERTYY